MMGEDGAITILSSKEGVTQDDPLAIVVYGIVMLPLTRILQNKVTDLLQL